MLGCVDGSTLRSASAANLLLGGRRASEVSPIYLEKLIARGMSFRRQTDLIVDETRLGSSELTELRSQWSPSTL